MRKILLFLTLIISSQLFGQDEIVMSNGTFSTCNGTFYDDGGSGGAAYSPTNYTITICPDNPGDVIQLDFSAFALQTSPGNGNSDTFTVYDGDAAGGPGIINLGTYTGNALQGLNVTGTTDNLTGCLTIVFSDNGPDNVNSPGWEAAVTCTTPCANPVSASAITNPTPQSDIQSVSVCIGEDVTFSSAGSFAQPGFNIASYNWNFDDGTTQEGLTADATHSFDEAGEYVVTLSVQDNNGCSSLNINPLQVLVSTTPLFPTLEDISTCLGEEVVLTGAAQSTQWSSLPPQVVAGQTYLADGAGFTYSTSITYDIFEPDAVLESCDDLLGIVVNMEHSYMGDLGITITCPDGTTVDLVEWGVNGGGGTFLGEAIDDGGTDPGVGYTYTWSPDATNGTWGENSGGVDILPAGTYEAQGNLCDLVGCPLNGAWTFGVSDNLAIDNGYIFYWGLDLNPDLFPGITTFTPSIGIDADSSYWTGPNIIENDGNWDIITVLPDAPGSYDYTYNVINSFGCAFDTTITLTITQAPFVSAGPDLLYLCDEVQLLGGFQGMPIPTCSADAGSFDYCYDDQENMTWTYCADTPGDGTAMVITFNQGQAETCCDFLTFYDGPDTSSPIIAQNVTGILDGQSFVGNSGCITMQFTSDGSVACSDGFYTPWQWDVSCTTGGPDFTWEWEPQDFLDNPNVMQPYVSGLPQTTTFTVTGYPVGHPQCFSTDEVVVTLDQSINPGTDTSIDYCINGAAINMFDELQGNPTPGGVWTNPAGAVVTEIFTPGTDNPGDYTYSLDNGTCVVFATMTMNASTVPVLTIPNDTSICWAGTLNFDLYNITGGVAPYSYEWTYNGTPVSAAQTLDYDPIESGDACLEVIDQCGVSSQECFFATVEDPLDVVFIVDTTAGCWPISFNFSTAVDPTSFATAAWEMGDGNVVSNVSNFSYFYEEPGIYDVSLLMVTPLGCTYSHSESNYISVFSRPVAEFYGQPQPTDVSDTEIHFHDLSSGQIVEYNWTFEPTNVLGTSIEQNPIFEFPSDQGGVYNVQLAVVDNNGCDDVYTATITINDIFQYYIPNSFTPNGDGINDVWKMYGADIDETRFKLQVFNRWGDVVFETTDPEVFWTGNHQFGEYYIGDGIYQWRARVASKSTGEKKDIQGTVNLMR